jgi:hypothetical protein
MTEAHAPHPASQWLLSEDLDKLYESGRTLLHWAAYAGQLIEVPRGLITTARLRAADNDGVQVIHAAAVGKCLNAIPAGLLDAALLQQRDGNLMTVFHHASRNSCLDQIPTQLLTQESLSLGRGGDGHTIFHEAALCGSLAQLPPDLLTAANLTRWNTAGFTPLHYGADRLHQFPEAVLTKENLTVEDRNGRSVIHQAASGTMRCGEDNRCFLCPDGFRQVPLSVLFTCRDVVLEGKTVLEHLSPEQRTLVRGMSKAPQRAGDSGKHV